MRHARNVFEFLDEVRQRPSMYVGSLRDLEAMLRGYGVALDVHDIDEGVPSIRHFGDWLRYRTGLSLSAGWARAIESEESDEQQQIERFFGFVDEFRELEVRAVASVELGPQHGATGKRVVVGLDGRMETPEAVEVVQYAPEPLHFLRFRYGGHLQVQHLLTVNREDVRSDGASTLEDAMRWVEDEFQVVRSEWVAVG